MAIGPERVSVDQQSNMRRSRYLAVFAGAAGLTGLCAILGLPPFAPRGTGPVDGLWVYANLLLTAILLSQLGGVLLTHFVWREPRTTSTQRGAVATFGVVEIGLGGMGMLGKVSSGMEPQHEPEAWALALALVGLGSVALAVAIGARRREQSGA